MPYCLSWRKPCLATEMVPRRANSARTIEDGTVVVFVPAPFELTMLGPYTASNRTANHIATIAMDAHISGILKNSAH